jgi:serine/threonine-protein kinase
MSQENPLQPGRSFRGLLIHSQLGGGGMGIAYLASHPILRIPLVVKVFTKTLDHDIFREAHLAARVTSPYTVPVIDAGFEQQVPYLVQPYVDGLDFQEVFTRLKTISQVLPLSAGVSLLLHASYGLHAIHQTGVLHRDVKPANLFLRGNGITTIGDFGIATSLSQQTGNPGTPPFMAPEQLAEEPLDRSTDMYALGITAHLLLTGTMPFSSPIEKFQQPYVPPSSVNPQAAYLFAVIERMLQYHQSERYSTALVAAQTLARIAAPKSHYLRISSNQFRLEYLTVTLKMGDLTQTTADVLVSASHWSLVMDMGVSKALRKAGGKQIEQEALALAPATMGEVIWTQAGNLPARFVAHAVAALKGAICIQRCVLRVLLGCAERQVSTVAFPSLGSGAGEVPMELAAQLTLEAIKTFAHVCLPTVEHILIVLYDQQAYDCWMERAMSL